ncbi:MAG: transposase [Pseudodonghicola sp.]
MKELKIKLMERMLGAELTAHLGYEEGKEAPLGQTNRRNGASTKVLKSQEGEMPGRCLATATAASSPSWSKRARPGSMGSTTRSSGSTRPG